MNGIFARAAAMVAVLACAQLQAVGGISVATVEDQGLAPGTYRNAANPVPAGTPVPFSSSGFFTSNGVSFHNVNGAMKYGPYTYSYWSGFSISNTKDKTTNGIENQYSAITGAGSGGSATYAVASTSGSSAYINLAPGSSIISMDVTNTTYAALTMAEGDPYGFTQPFSRDLGSYFLLTITGYSGLDHTGSIVASTGFYLADFRHADPLDDYILNAWKTINFSSAFASAASLVFTLSSSDNDPLYGMNTPAYFALDNLVVSTPSAVPEPTSVSLCLAGLGMVGFVTFRKRRAAERV